MYSLRPDFFVLTGCQVMQVQQAARTELRRLVKAAYGPPPLHRADCRTVYERAVLDASGNEAARVLPSVPIHKIAALMQELGARTRFQAGAQAAIRDLGNGSM